ncbi:MAG: hypothetical protein JOZ81_24055 [Chloroflexi bacterium]|nr:hypothetical protein [Chloroflexota bacterium]
MYGRRQIGLLGVTEDVAGDLVAWALLLLGVVFGVGMLGAVEALTVLSGQQMKLRLKPSSLWKGP